MGNAAPPPSDAPPSDAPPSQHAAPLEPWESIGLLVHVFWFLLLALCAGFLLWAHLGILDIVSIAPGEVVPVRKVQQVQHLEGGIVREILVKEGDPVRQDQPLVVLDAIASRADVDSMRLHIQALRIDLQRLHAEAARKKQLTFTTDEEAGEDAYVGKANRAQLMQQAIALFNARRRTLLSQQSAQRDALTQRKQELLEIQARQRNQRDRLKLLQEQVGISSKMLATETTSRYEHLNLLKESNELRSRIDEDDAALKRLQAAVAQSEEALTNVWNAHMATVQTDIEETQRTLNDLLLRLSTLEDSMQRTILRSPVMGVVKTLHTVSQGGVVAPGGTVLDIVPGGDQLIVEAHLPAQDVGYVHKGQGVIIRLASADAARFGKLHGVVTHIGPDTLVNQEGSPYYIVRITTEQNHFQKGRDRYILVPGVVVSAGILTGQRTVLEYILDPFMRGMAFALSER